MKHVSKDQGSLVSENYLQAHELGVWPGEDITVISIVRACFPSTPLPNAATLPGLVLVLPGPDQEAIKVNAQAIRFA